MLLLHTTGITKIGEVRRYTVTYTPSQDRVHPLPTVLHLLIKNTAALPLRAAYLHGPYTLYVSVCTKDFKPWSSKDFNSQERERSVNAGVPVYDPNLKAGASFYAMLPIPPKLFDDALDSFPYHQIRMNDSAHPCLTSNKQGCRSQKVTWIIEIVSQAIFSTSATVGYEMLLSRDKKCLSFGFPLGPGSSPRTSTPNSDHGIEIASHAVTVQLQGTKDLWNLPPFPSWNDELPRSNETLKNPEEQEEDHRRRQQQHANRKPRNIHLVILTHGLHSNTGADMLFLKEAIDNEGMKSSMALQGQCNQHSSHTVPAAENCDDEQIIVRGYHENACNTERGIKFLGKRLAKFVLHLANPEKNPLPRDNGHNKLRKCKMHQDRPASHQLLQCQDDYARETDPLYKVTSISFIGHSLGGLVQIYAIAYIHAHSPSFFHETKPINFVTLATPFLGLSNENPLYVRFALDFGLVGRTGQDLGLTWKSPNSALSIGSLTSKNFPANRDNTSKPLLSILPTGPAHDALKMFRNRTLYANVVNDGIVPLRTSCLLFLDWKGLGRVEKARRGNSTMGGLVEWCLGQLVTQSGANGTRKTTANPILNCSSRVHTTGSNATTTSSDKATENTHKKEKKPISKSPSTVETSEESLGINSTPSPFSSIISLFRPHTISKTEHTLSPKAAKIYHRSQTQSPKSVSSRITLDNTPVLSTVSSPATIKGSNFSSNIVQAITNSSSIEDLMTPPKTTIFEAASDILNPPLPTTQFIIDEHSRPRAIFHERVYHATDIPPQNLLEKQRAIHLPRDKTNIEMRVEERIARGYHEDMSWRKVLVRLEPDAHNNMIVRRTFPNAYGWPVVQHLVETHFGLAEIKLKSDKNESTFEDSSLLEELKRLNGDEALQWTEEAWDITDDSDFAENVQSKFSDIPEGLKRPPDAIKRKSGSVKLSNVCAEAGQAPDKPKKSGRNAVGLGLRYDGNWFDRNDGSEAVKLLERCGSKGRGAPGRGES